jgi:thymidylate synthase
MVVCPICLPALMQNEQGLKPQLPILVTARDVLEHGWRATITGQREHGWFSGLLETLEPLDAFTVSRSILTNGSTIAAHVHHLWFCMAAINRRLESSPEATDWNEEWAIREIDAETWLRLKANLRREFERTLRWLESSSEGDAAQLNLVIEGIAHAAYHVGAIRQILVNLH